MLESSKLKRNKQSPTTQHKVSCSIPSALSLGMTACMSGAVSAVRLNGFIREAMLLHHILRTLKVEFYLTANTEPQVTLPLLQT